MHLLPSLSGVHAVFHVSMVRKHSPDPTDVVDWGVLVVDVEGTFKEGPIRITDSRDQIIYARWDCEASEGVVTDFLSLLPTFFFFFLCIYYVGELISNN